jgi:uncharacterized cupin superfamily protein
MSENYELQQRPKRAEDHGRNKYFVELFLTERFVLTVYADDAQKARNVAQSAAHRMKTGMMAFSANAGVKHVHFDEDYDFQVMTGEVQLDDDDGE